MYTVCVCVCVLLQSCLTLHDPMDYSPPGFSIQRILQARILEWVSISSSRESSPPRDWTHIPCIVSRFLYPLRHQGSPVCPLMFGVRLHSDLRRYLRSPSSVPHLLGCTGCVCFFINCAQRKEKKMGTCMTKKVEFKNDSCPWMLEESGNYF